MKIGILTHPLRTNYGGILQNYALQTVLKRMGHEVLTIDWHNDKSYIYRLISFIKRNMQHYIGGMKNIPTAFNVNLSRKEFLYQTKYLQSFIAEHISTTEYISSSQKLSKSLFYKFDAYIVGSDQVWLKSYFPHTFLNFTGDLNVKRIFYAASGRLDWMKDGFQQDLCAKLIKKFDAISVRENISIAICEKYLGVTPTLVLDPVFLLENQDYFQLIKNINVTKKDGLVTYILDKTEDKTKLIGTVASKLGLKILTANPKLENGFIPSIENWLASFYYSKFVITDSFHGMVLSIVLRKPFIIYANPKRGIERFKTVLSQFKLESRLVYSFDDFYEKSTCFDDIDYASVDIILKQKRKESLDFIIKSLSNEKK
ncbi:polysaccharide pyruvyl transferase family protein [Phocaeicola faecalis]|uniref:polysaccharide pyruvyl transferase family protein n=1 Tax=Phocaeicola faecalis TaxID=2786956 RepID=UPI001F20F33B|nr:polysaccharide pyruvyl transferase family protein [Phocaeicola faecalis]